MPQARSLTRPTDIRYLYDGTLAGFYCCVHESVYGHELPLEILISGQDEPSLLPSKFITTDEEKAQRVRAAVAKKLSPRTRGLTETVFLSCLKEKELHLLIFLLLGFEVGGDISGRLAEPRVAVLLDAERHLLHERHLLLGFLRFSDYDGLLAATITPKNFVLPLLRSHFVARYPNEDFVIVDKTYHHALLYQHKRCELMAIDHVQLPAPSEQELRYRSLWKQFYRTIAIESRRNERCRMTHMPKRYWGNMLEVADLLDELAAPEQSAALPQKA